jgi:hypothetical protein
VNALEALARAIGSGLVVPLSVGAAMALLVTVAAPWELAITIVVAVVGVLIGVWLCLFRG